MALAELNLENLDGSNGFTIPGIERSRRLGRSVSNIGDVNGDGFDDLIIGAPYSITGEAYVVFGTTEDFESELDLTTLDGTNGFTITGIDEEDELGSSVSSAGDINGDGIDDLIIGAPRAGELIYNSYGSSYNNNRGEAYVVFGTTEGFESELDLTTLDGTNGFTIPGIDEKDGLGFSVARAGDVNGDGIDDLIIGAPGAGELTTVYTDSYDGYYFGYLSEVRDGRGEAYVIFGTTEGFESELDLTTLDGTNGFTISGIDDFAGLGSSVSSAGDINGDGFDDLVIGAPASYFDYDAKVQVVFGKSESFESKLDLTTLDGTNGFTIGGLDARSRLGISVSSAGDINGDGIDDLIIGAPGAGEPRFDGYLDGRGEAYVIFGTTEGFESELDLTTLDGTSGFTISGINIPDRLGFSVSSAGDFNGDGIGDFIVGAREADSNEKDLAGEVYLIFGKSNGFDAEIDLTKLDVNDGLIIGGIDGGERLGSSVSSGGDINGDGFDDLIIGAPYGRNDTLITGEAYIIFGFNPLEETPEITGTANDDVLSGTTEAETISGLGGNDSLKGLAGDDTVLGGDGNDTLRGNNGNDVINGGDGNDNIWGQADNDLIDGGKGADRILGNNGEDTLFGGDQIDTLFGGNGNDSLFGDAGDDQVVGNAGNDTLFGGADNDILFAGTGEDQLFGEEGDDVLWGQADNDFVDGGAGTDVLYGNNGNDVLIGGDGTDSLFGNLGNDALFGGADNDILFGNDGNDNLYGGEGNDTLWSGSGNDVFELTRGDNVGVDRIKDYQDGLDKFKLSDRFGLGSLEFSDLTITQKGNTAHISITENSQLLAIVDNTNVAQLESSDFILE